MSAEKQQQLAFLSEVLPFNFLPQKQLIAEQQHLYETRFYANDQLFRRDESIKFLTRHYNFISPDRLGNAGQHPRKEVYSPVKYLQKKISSMPMVGLV